MLPTVLIVSDDRDLCAAAARALRGDYRLLTAPHAGHALLAGFTTRIDVLVAELSMADGSGPSLADRLRRLHPGLQTIYLADAGTPCDRDDILVRPFTRDDLEARIERAREAGETLNAQR